jgi:hypothetical protein
LSPWRAEHRYPQIWQKLGSPCRLGKRD